MQAGDNLPNGDSQDSLTADRTMLSRLFLDWQQWPGREAKFNVVPVMGREADQYLLLTMGWDGYRRTYREFAME